mmetsp:Transcript_72680/g.106537  ORF Transcript_72680/g.106537 Transcript_72680/m.106537 type:complete len:206 (-) Transcript_72680:372-989(-)
MLLDPVVAGADTVEEVSVVVPLRLVHDARFHTMISVLRAKMFTVPVSIDFTIVVVVHGELVSIVLVIAPLIVNDINTPMRAGLVGVVVIIADVLLTAVGRVDPVSKVALRPVPATAIVIDAIVIEYVVFAKPVARDEPLLLARRADLLAFSRLFFGKEERLRNSRQVGASSMHQSRLSIFRLLLRCLQLILGLGSLGLEALDRVL